MATGTLFVCATPIGNLKDCSFRLLETLKKVNCIAAEDPKKTKVLLAHFEIKAKLIGLQKYNEAERVNSLANMLSQGKDVALVSDAGTPNIADPGAHIISQLIEKGHSVIPIPGPSAVTALLSVSGILANKFCFMGFFPKKNLEAKKLIEQSLALDLPIVFFETAKRLIKSINWINDNYHVHKIAIGKEITKKFETYISGSCDKILEDLKNHNIKGEWCFTVWLSKQQDQNDIIETKIKQLIEFGLTNKQVVEVVRLMGFPKNKAYRIVGLLKK
jgi:16S rRNA (cytidine1402-2'-O)-methyltransferase